MIQVKTVNINRCSYKNLFLKKIAAATQQSNRCACSVLQADLCRHYSSSRIEMLVSRTYLMHICNSISAECCDQASRNQRTNRDIWLENTDVRNRLLVCSVNSPCPAAICYAVSDTLTDRKACHSSYAACILSQRPWPLPNCFPKLSATSLLTGFRSNKIS